MQFTIAKTKEELQAALAELTLERQTVALVPTMGALHPGHLSLVEEARQYGGVVMSLFVNPLQFTEEKDYNAYPRVLEEDAQMAQDAGVGVLYAPDIPDMYTPYFSTAVTMGGLAEILEGACRPGHFNGVCTVLAKLFMRVLPNVAVFGEKDYQQLLVVRRLVEDLDFGMQVIGVPTMREKSGLALSSRNVHLNDKEREQAPGLYKQLQATAKAMQEKGGETLPYLKQAYEQLTTAGFIKVDYIAICDANTLEPLANVDRPARLLAAAWLGQTRLIDNIAVTPAGK